MPKKSSLSELEEEFMRVLWDRSEATAATIQAALPSERTLKDSTVRTILTRLEEKGYVQHKTEGRTFVYSPVQHRSSVAVRAVQQILDRFCHGSLESLLVGMVDGEIVDTAELERIVARLAGKQEADSAGPKKGETER